MQFTTDDKGVGHSEFQSCPSFTVKVERHDRHRFQAQGHFVSGLKDRNGFRREWDGPLVFVGTVWYEMRDVQNNVTDSKQVLRVMADTPDELMRMMSEAIAQQFFSSWLAQLRQSDIFERFRVMYDEQNEFMAYLATRYPEMDTHGMTTATAARKLIAVLDGTIQEITVQYHTLQAKETLRAGEAVREAQTKAMGGGPRRSSWISRWWRKF